MPEPSEPPTKTESLLASAAGGAGGALLGAFAATMMMGGDDELVSRNVAEPQVVEQIVAEN